MLNKRSQFTASESCSGHSRPIFKQIQATESISSRSVHWTTCEHRAMPTSPEATPQQPVQIISIPSNFPVPNTMVCKGDLTSNWEFFKQQWQDYEVATGLDHKSQAIRVATFRSVMGKDRLQIFLNHNFGDEEITITSLLSALEDYFLPKQNVVYERYVFNSCIQTPEETVDG